MELNYLLIWVMKRSIRRCWQLNQSIISKSINLRHNKQGFQFCALIRRFRKKIWQFCRAKLMEFQPKLFYRGFQQVSFKPRYLLGSVGGFISTFNWENDRISNDELFYHFNEINHVRLLLKMTLFCQKCKKRMKFETDDPKIQYCSCQSSAIRKFKHWEPFLERDHLLVWRKSYRNSFKYRVYGKYTDVSALDFLRVQIDLDYRKQWDASAEQLYIVEKDPNPNLNSDIIYWEMKWPMFFENRDFVFNRRFIVHQEQKMIVILNKVTEHPFRPQVAGKTRVLHYWSCMVIRPFKDINEPGMEFCLTYFDDPGINLPLKMTTWVAMKAMPEFLVNLYSAAKNYDSYCKDNLIEPIKIYDFNENIDSVIESADDPLNQDGYLVNKIYNETNFWKHQSVHFLTDF